MKIIIEDSGVAFNKIVKGEVFQFGCDFYIKVDEYQAYNLSENCLSNFGENVPVTLKKATLSII